MEKKELEKLKALAEAASPGPWTFACESGEWFLMSDEYKTEISIEDNIEYLAELSPDRILKLVSALRGVESLLNYK